MKNPDRRMAGAAGSAGRATSPARMDRLCLQREGGPALVGGGPSAMPLFSCQVVSGLKQRILKLEQQCKEKDNTIRYGDTTGGLRALPANKPTHPVCFQPQCLHCPSCSASPHLLCPRPLAQLPLSTKRMKVNSGSLSPRDSISFSSFLVPATLKKCFPSLVLCECAASPAWAWGLGWGISPHTSLCQPLSHSCSWSGRTFLSGVSSLRLGLFREM